MKMVCDDIVEHEGISIKHECYHCDKVIYNENPDEVGWYHNWLGDWVCTECYDVHYHNCKCGNIIRMRDKLCTDCEMDEIIFTIKKIKEN